LEAVMVVPWLPYGGCLFEVRGKKNVFRG